ncbi:hypothetical protein [Spirosoma sp. KUDC1026]|uniref:hypothetical protein n=1 Tax=Spirosoma sp. KUDC1026 TaxID=2745947 RepID=UPI00159B8852|nr:hypothetical protein [Spirosoma sp. KUDC1026]QKZ12015.1 hypothetical protein HU175_04980 [Spirosoma sp. KUDC1026]
MRNSYTVPFFLFFLFLTTASWAQVDSVIVTGQIKNLSARLYRESPTVLVSRNNILQASRELVRPAPLAVDGTFRVSLPLIYTQEEMYFTYGRISTAFLAAPGTVTITLNADSLFTAAVPFQFAGTNAQVNQQYARYKAFEATYTNKPDGRKITNSTEGKSDVFAYQIALDAYRAPFLAYAKKEKPFPLVSRWLNSVARYNAAAFLYERAQFLGNDIDATLSDTLRPADDGLLTAARALAMNRFAVYAVQQSSTPEITRQNSGLSVRSLSDLLLRYGRVTDDERSRLEGYVDNNNAKASDINFFNRLIKRSNDTIQRLVFYELLQQRTRTKFKEAATDYVTAYWLADVLPGLTLDFSALLYDYARPRIDDPALKQSLAELYALQIKDSSQVRQAVRTLQKAQVATNALDLGNGIFVTRDAFTDGRALLDRVLNANRGKVVYLLLTSPNSEGGRQAAIDAQRLRDTYRIQDFALVYLPAFGDDPRLWIEFSAKNKLTGDHLLATSSQLEDLLGYLRSNEEISATIIGRTGKVDKRNAPLPASFDEVKKVLVKSF